MKLYRPSAPLDAYVELIWLLPSAAASPGTTELALPTGTLELVINLDDDRIDVLGHRDLGRTLTFQGPTLCGVHDRPFGLAPSVGRHRILGVHFRPGGAAAWLPLPLGELHNLHVALADVVGDEAWRLRDTLARVSCDAELFTVVERHLTRALQDRLHPVVRQALRELDADGEQPAVSALVERSGYSHRRFSELFRRSVGLGAKQYSALARFQYALRLIERRRCFDWQDLVAVCGYYDQSHLIHEFRRHGRMTPAQYLTRRSERFNHARAV